MKLLHASLVLVLASSAFAQQAEKKPKPPKPVAPVINRILLDLPAVQPQVVRPMNWPFVAPQRARVEGVVGGLRIIEPKFPQFSGEQHFPGFIDQQIKTLKTTFKLDAKAERRLKLAAKGVKHRTQQAQTEKARKAAGANQRGPNLIWGNVVPMRDRSADFQKRLTKSRIWTGTLKRLLSTEQLKKWETLRRAKSVKPTVLRPDGLLQPIQIEFAPRI